MVLPAHVEASCPSVAIWNQGRSMAVRTAWHGGKGTVVSVVFEEQRCQSPAVTLSSYAERQALTARCTNVWSVSKSKGFLRTAQAPSCNASVAVAPSSQAVITITAAW